MHTSLRNRSRVPGGILDLILFKREKGLLRTRFLSNLQPKIKKALHVGRKRRQDPLCRLFPFRNYIFIPLDIFQKKHQNENIFTEPETGIEKGEID